MRYPLLFTYALLTSFLLLNPSAYATSCYGDYIPPVAICDAHTVVALGADGVATVYAYNLDDGSYDNCEIDNFKAARMWPGWCPYGVVDDTQFRPYVQFCCEDVGESIWIIMKVTDTHGNSNTCMVQVTVQSGTSNIHCPYDKTIYCDYWFDWNDLYDPWNTFFGWPTSSSGCGSPNVTVQVFDHRTSCGVGHIKRVFSTGGGGYGGYGGYGNTCTQFIWVVDYHPFNGYSIHWPSDYHGDGCDMVDVHPNSLPHPYGKPTWYDDGNCSLIGYSWDDKIFYFDGACTKIVRKWTVIDWCVYDPNNHYSGGIWTHTQIIKLSDHTKPVFEYCHDITVNGTETDCKGWFEHHPQVWDDCTPAHDLKYEYKIDLYANGSNDIIKHGHKYAYELLPSGKHKVWWFVDDNCGNISSCWFFVTVEDKKAPTPVCFANLSTVLMPQGGMLTLWARDFDASSFDNCTKAHQLRFSFSPNVYEASRTFTCDDVGLVALKVYVTDLSGNQAYCNTFVTLTDNGPVCPEMNPITGTVEMFTAEAISGADVSLYKVTPDGDVMDMQKESAADGTYKVGFGTTAFDRRLVVTKEAEPLAGISTLDMVYLLGHIMGSDPLVNSTQRKAADVDGSGRVGVNDLLMLRDAFLSGGLTLHGTELPWNFYPSNCPWLANDELGCSFSVLIDKGNPDPPYDFIGYKLGDINGDIMEDPTQRSPVRFPVGVKYDKAEQAYAFIALEDAEILGMQMSIGTSLALSKSALSGGELNIGNQNSYVDDVKRVINMSWTSPATKQISNGQILFYLSVPEFQALRGNQFSWNKGAYRSEIYLTDKKPVQIEIRMLDGAQSVDPLHPAVAGQVLQSENSVIQRSSGSSVNVEGAEPFFAPNPIVDAGVLYFNLDDNQDVNFEVFTSEQKLVVVRRISGVRGLNEVMVTEEELGMPGVFLYRLTVGNKAYTGKIINVD